MDEQLLPEPQFGGIVVSDYFRVKGDEYIYLGGLPGTLWIIGEGYKQDDIRLLQLMLTREEEDGYFALSMGNTKPYIILISVSGNMSNILIHYILSIYHS